MSHPSLSIVTFAAQTFNRSVSNYKQSIEGLTEEQVFWQPAPESNTIGWLGWHLTRRKDYYSSHLAGEDQVWVTQGWFEKFGMNAVETGTGHSTAEVKAFRPPLDLLVGYIESMNELAVARLERVQDLDAEVDLDAGRGMRPRSQVWNPMLSDCLQHTGQIAYIRGMLTGLGWFAV
jgi:Protein of unknown function (DUF664)